MNEGTPNKSPRHRRKLHASESPPPRPTCVTSNPPRRYVFGHIRFARSVRIASPLIPHPAECTELIITSPVRAYDPTAYAGQPPGERIASLRENPRRGVRSPYVSRQERARHYVTVSLRARPAQKPRRTAPYYEDAPHGSAPRAERRHPACGEHARGRSEPPLSTARVRAPNLQAPPSAAVCAPCRRRRSRSAASSTCRAGSSEHHDQIPRRSRFRTVVDGQQSCWCYGPYSELFTAS